ncbi:hypothetical protein [Pseudarthrobacter sp. NS4]|uniref:hypothetical protein n=1 Tax=Pseudarthrobacter sp. NS4 TaxID=2973976 RepID=UPI002161EDAB|nr:hypothetical protein [Pseudarthrobacter sp. NS4]
MNPGARTESASVGSTTRPAKRPARRKGGRGVRADWARLTGHTVEVWLLDEHVTTGVVDQAAEDDSVLWIAGEGISTRRLFDKSTGYQVWV